MKIDRDIDNLHQMLEEQCGFLTRSNASFDEGYEDESKRIAVAIRVLLHDTNNSKSLLSQLGVKNKIGYLSTSPGYDDNNPLTFTGLVFSRTIVGNGNANYKYIPFLNECPWGFNELDFPSWWDEIILKDKGNNTYTRKDIVLFVANKDGGAHVDPELDEEYKKLTQAYDALGWELHAEGRTVHMEANCVEATLRQISYEILSSLEKIRK